MKHETLGDLLRKVLERSDPKTQPKGNTMNQNALLSKICDYLASLGLCGLYDSEYNEVRQLIRENRKVDAIKALCAYTENNLSAAYNRPANNEFASWLETQGAYTYDEYKTLGLKEAKDIVDFLIANPGPAGL